MKKSILSIILFITLLFSLSACNDKSMSNEKAEKSDERTITIINETGSDIKSLDIQTEDGTSILQNEKEYKDNCSWLISDSWDDYSNFIIVLNDKYGMTYKKLVNVDDSGRSSVKVTADDYVKNDGDWHKIVSKWFDQHK